MIQMVTLKFMLYLLIVCLLGFVVLTVKKAFEPQPFTATVPQPSEVSMQLASMPVTETVEQQRMRTPVANSHWYRHTFERPRRKG